MSNLALIAGGDRVAPRRLAALVLAATAFLAVGAATAPPARAAGMGCTVNRDWAEMKTAWATEVIALTNAHRATLGLSALVPSESLKDAAEWKAAHMAKYGYMSHDDPAPPVDRSWDQRIEDCGYTYGMGENIAFGYRSPSAVVAGWLGSKGHRENIENPDFKVIGSGAALNSDGTAYWAQTFGTHIVVGDRDAAEESVPAEPTQVVADAPADLNDPVVDNAADTTSNVRADRIRTLIRAWSWAKCSARRWCFR